MLRLPTLGVTAAVVRVDSDARTLVPPSDYTTVGWWENGVAPGASQGTALIVGHTVHTGGGALDNLGDIHSGDHVVVDRRRDDLSYRVASVRTYGKASFGDHAGQILSQSGPGRLAIVTCGDWNGEIFLTNIVVIATDPKVIS
jgi:LPXTG-site transpeptidase (sortase) family protein